MTARLASSRWRRVVLVLGGLVLVTLMAVTADGDDGPAYLTAPVERGDVVSTVTATGRLEAIDKVEVASQLSGEIIEVLADFNHNVSRGQMLARLDPATFEARLREETASLEVARASVLIQEAAVLRAEAAVLKERQALGAATARWEALRSDLEEAHADLRRKEVLAARGVIAAQQIERARRQVASATSLVRAAEAEAHGQEAAVQAAESGVRMAQAQHANAAAVVQERQAALDAAAANLERTVLRAPIDGVVISRSVSRGQTVAASLEAKTLFTLARSLDRIRLEVFVDEADVGRIALGQRVAFAVDAYPEREFIGTVDQIRRTPVISDNVTSFVVTAATANAELALFPGMTALARIVVAETKNALQLPNAALRFQPPADARREPAIGTAAAEEMGSLTVAAVRTTGGRVEASAAHRSNDAERAVSSLPAGAPGTVWIAGADGVPRAVPVLTGMQGERTSVLVAGRLGEAQQLIVGVAPAPNRGWIARLRRSLSALHD